MVLAFTNVFLAERTALTIGCRFAAVKTLDGDNQSGVRGTVRRRTGHNSIDRTVAPAGSDAWLSSGRLARPLVFVGSVVCARPGLPRIVDRLLTLVGGTRCRAGLPGPAVGRESGNGWSRTIGALRRGSNLQQHHSKEESDPRGHAIHYAWHSLFTMHGLVREFLSG